MSRGDIGSGLLMGVSMISGLVSAIAITEYLTTPRVEGADQLIERAAIIQQYTGPSVQEDLAYTLHALNYIEENNPEYSAEIKGLELLVESVRNTLPEMSFGETNSALAALGGELYEWGVDHYKDPDYRKVGLISGAVALGTGAIVAAREEHY